MVRLVTCDVADGAISPEPGGRTAELALTVKPGYDDPILLRGQRLEDGAALAFGDAGTDELLIPAVRAPFPIAAAPSA